MSLKAKLEAVIYAAEEPVTLAQLAGLFQAEILEERQARLDAEAAGQEAASQDAVSQQGELSAESESSVAELQATVEVDAVLPLAEPAGIREPVAVSETAVAEAAVPTAEDEKRIARQRDREIRDELRRIVNTLIAEYEQGDRGMEIREIAGGYRVATKPEYHDAVRGFVKSLKPPMKLSLQALETLAVIAYKQPVTAPEISEIRGVDSGGVLGSLVSRKLITTAGRKQVIGRPILYKTTKEFLLRFGLKDVNELPSIEEFEKMAGELEETEAIASPAAEQLPFAQNEAALVEDDELQAAEAIEADDEAEVRAAAGAVVGVADETSSDEAGDLPGVRVETEVKPSSMVDAGEATASVGQPGEGD